MEKSQRRVHSIFLVIVAFLIAAWLTPLAVPEAAESRIYLPLLKKPFGFSPNPDGYGFQNYGNESRSYDPNLDLGAADLVNLFGEAKVCVSGSNPCVLTDPAETWRKKQLEAMGNGHCEGMAVTSLRFLYRQSFYNGKKSPGDFQSGKERVFDLTLDQGIGNYIAYYYVQQDLAEVSNPGEGLRTTQTPKQILELIRQALQEGPDPYTLGIYKTDPQTGKLSAGHAIVPYAVADQGGGIQWLTVYDNNFPGEARNIVFDTNQDRWSYNSASNPADPPELYTGDAATHSLEPSRLSWRNREPYTCPFCAGAEQVEFFTTRNGDLLITDMNGRRLGLDPQSNQMVSEILGGQVLYGRGVRMPHYRLPSQPTGSWYRVAVSVRDPSRMAKGSNDLVMVGPGFVVGFEGLQLQAGQTLHFSLSADGRALLPDPGQPGPALKIFGAYED